MMRSSGRNDGREVSGGRRVVNSNSVTSQFASLTRDKDSLRKAIDEAEQERTVEESHMTDLTARQVWLTDKIRTAHASLGAKTKKRQMLRGEESRLRETISQDREALVDVGMQHEKTEQDERDRKSFFLTELDTLNDEMEVALQQYEDKALLNLISVSSVEFLLRKKTSTSMDCSAPHIHIPNVGEDGIAKDEAQRKEHAKPSFKCESERLVLDSLELLKEASTKLGSEVAMKRDMEQKICFQRSEALTGEQALTTSALDELERSWEHEWDSTDQTVGFPRQLADGERLTGTYVAVSQATATQDVTLNAVSFYDTAGMGADGLHFEDPVVQGTF